MCCSSGPGLRSRNPDGSPGRPGREAALRVLIVEDTPDRQKTLVRLYREHAWVLVNTARRAISLLDAYTFDLISLDYDLAGPEKGDLVAAHICNSASAQALVIVHSMNARGAQRIVAELPDAAAVPLSKITRDNGTFNRLRSQLRDGVDVDWQAVFGGGSSAG